MSSKVCVKCGEEKALGEFYKKYDGKLGRHAWCKKCHKIWNRQNYKKNRDSKKAYRERHKSKQSSYMKKYYKENKTTLKEKKEEYYKANKEYILSKNKEWAKRNKPRMKVYRNKYRNKPLVKFSENIRSRINCGFRKMGYTKRSRTHKILGCSYKEFEQYLNNNPYGFEVGHDGLDLDHVIPVCTATTEEELLELNHYTNFQLLPSDYNRNIKKDNPWDQVDFEAWLENQKILEGCLGFLEQ
jgi:hypothetical protein